MDEKILLNWGSYDVDNFGDLLFPHLVEHFMGCHYAHVVHVSPTGTRCIWPDAKTTVTPIEAIAFAANAHLVVGGGNLVSYTTSSSINYVADPEFAQGVHQSFSWVPHVLHAKYGIPYAYNRIGVAKRIPLDRQRSLRITIEPAALMSCRDEASAEHLRRAGVTTPIMVAPDSAMDVRQVFPKQALLKLYRDEVRAKYGIPVGATTAVIHLKQRYFKEQWAHLHQVLQVLRERRIHPIFVPLGICHGDDEFLSRLEMPTAHGTRILRPETMSDVLSLLASSTYYLGSSLHGAIAALAYANNVVIVADEERSRLSKFSGFLSQVKLAHCLYDSWADLAAALSVRGLHVFDGIGEPESRECDGSRGVWERICRSLADARRCDASALDETVAGFVKHHYGI